MSNYNIPDRCILNNELRNRRNLSAELYPYEQIDNLVEVCYVYLKELEKMGFDREKILNNYMINWTYVDDETLKEVLSINECQKYEKYKDLFDKQYLFGKYETYKSERMAEWVVN